MSYIRSLTVLSCFVCLTAMLSGCGGEDAVDGYHLSGKVMFDGKPVPSGKIFFVPDAAKEGSGHSGYADINNGQFDTSAEGGKPHAGGPMTVKIEGMDPNASTEQAEDDTSGEVVMKALFPTYQTTADLPKEDSTQDFEVPASAADAKVVPESTGNNRGGP